MCAWIEAIVEVDQSVVWVREDCGLPECPQSDAT